MLYNQNSGYGKAIFTNLIPNSSVGRNFFVAASTDPGYTLLKDIFRPDSEGTPTLYSTITAALAACVSGRGDTITISQNYTTAPTSAEISSAMSKQVWMQPATSQVGRFFVTHRAAAVLPATTTAAIFTVTGKIKMFDLIGEVTTICDATAANLKVTHVPTVGTAVDIAANVAMANRAVGLLVSVDGTFATAMKVQGDGAQAGQTESKGTYLTAGDLSLVTSGTNTGALKWLIRYLPLEPGAQVIAA